MGGIIHWFTKNHVAANFLMLALLIAGFSTWFGLKKEVFPETQLDIISVQVAYPNATASEVEKGVLVLLEDAVADVEGLERYSSSASEGAGALTIEVALGYQLRDVMDDVKTAVDAITNFPENIESPISVSYTHLTLPTTSRV